MPSIAQETRARVLAEFRARGIGTDPPLPLLDDFSRIDLRKPVEIGKRIVVLYALTGLAHDADGAKLASWLTECGLGDELLPSERRLLTKRSLSNQEEIDTSWKQESLYTLAWSVFLVDELAWPTHECDLDRLFRHIPPEVEVPQFLENLAIREEDVVFYQTDLHYCLHWLLRHPDVSDSTDSVRSVKRDIVLERRTALEWLMRRDVKWDDVSLDT